MKKIMKNSRINPFTVVAIIKSENKETYQVECTQEVNTSFSKESISEAELFSTMMSGHSSDKITKKAPRRMWKTFTKDGILKFFGVNVDELSFEIDETTLKMKANVNIVDPLVNGKYFNIMIKEATASDLASVTAQSTVDFLNQNVKKNAKQYVDKTTGELFYITKNGEHVFSVSELSLNKEGVEPAHILVEGTERVAASVLYGNVAEISNLLGK